MMKEHLLEKLISISIDDDVFKEFEDVYNYAMDMVIDETYQAMEGMYHNLNTLNIRGAA